MDASVGQQLYLARMRLGITQERLADRMDTSQSAVSRLEHNDEPTITALRKAARALGCRLEIKLRQASPRARPKRKRGAVRARCGG